MALINGMIEDDNNGVCLKKNRHYYKYDKILTGCTYYDSITEINENYNTGMYVLPYVNKNPHYTGDTINDFLTITGITMSDWFVNYINSLVTTGYTGYNNSGIEDRVIYNETDDEYYKIDHYPDHCETDISEKWGIVDYITNEIWNGIGNYFYNVLDKCDNETSDRYVKTMDINEFSPTYKNTNTYDKEITETIPVVVTNVINVLSASSLTLNGNIVSNGGFNIKRSGFCYSRNRIPTLSDSIALSTNWVSGPYSKIINNLGEDKYYYVRAFAENAIGVGYGEIKVVKTEGIDSFSITTIGPLNVGIRKLDIEGTISNSTLVNVKNVGVCWGTGINPTILNNKISSGYTNNNFQFTINNLENGKTYYFRSYAITKNFGIFYGENITTFIGGAPVLDELNVFNNNISRNYIELTSGILDIGWPNMILPDGSLTSISEAGFCYSTSSPPTTGSTKAIVADPINSFKKIVTGLTDNKTYYIRAYATNNASQLTGLTYSNEISATTKPNSAPILSQIDAKAISNKEIDVIGTILDDGGSPVTNYGVCWCKVEDYINESATGLTTGSTFGYYKNVNGNISSGSDFSVSITNDLTDNTNYYVNAYAVNVSGITYSDISEVMTYQDMTLYIDSMVELTSVSLQTNNGLEQQFNNNNFVFNDIKFNQTFTINIEYNPDEHITPIDNSIYNYFSTFEVFNNYGNVSIIVNTGPDFYPEYDIRMDYSF